MKKITGIIFDIDGVLYSGEEAVDGACYALNLIADAKIQFRCLSNTTRKSSDSISEKLKDFGFIIPKENIITPAVVVSKILNLMDIKKCFFLVTEDVCDDFYSSGLISDEINPEAVVIGDAGQNFNYERLNRVFRILIENNRYNKNKSIENNEVFFRKKIIVDKSTNKNGYSNKNNMAKSEKKDENMTEIRTEHINSVPANKVQCKQISFFALEMDKYWMDKDGLSLSAGPFIKGLEYATETNAYLIGKPSLLFFNSSLSSLGKDPHETLVVGDDIITDIGGAKNAGISGALVRTGKFREDKLISSGIKPDFILNSVSNLPEILGLK